MKFKKTRKSPGFGDFELRKDPRKIPRKSTTCILGDFELKKIPHPEKVLFSYEWALLTVPTAATVPLSMRMSRHLLGQWQLQYPASSSVRLCV
jgi:hypothetical protein